MKKCKDCDECVYIYEGSSACMEEEPRITLMDFSTQTDDYGWCRRRRRDNQLMKLDVTNHPYYCSKSNYYVGGYDNFGRSEYDSWSDFKEEWLGIGDDSLGIDSDLNYRVRFDITQNENSGAKDLWLFFLLQRRGIFSPAQVRNIKDSDMPETEKFLKRQWKYIKKM